MRCKDIGPPDAKIMLVGECPGASEEKTGVPFSGSSGLLLKQMLSHSGIQFRDCYVTNVVNVRPPKNNFDYFYNDKMPSHELQEGIDTLRKKIEAIRPQVVMPLGREALKAVCNKSLINEYRGTWLSYRGINVLPTYHPAYIMRVYKDHVVSELDFTKALTQVPQDNPPMILAPNLSQVSRWISDVMEKHKNSDIRVAFDIETIEKNVRCIAFYTKDYPAICIPFIRFSSSEMGSVGQTVVKVGSSSTCMGSYWSPKEEVIIIGMLNNFFLSGIPVVGQNSIGFDAPLLEDEFGFHIKNHFLDTMHAWHCLYSELPMGLGFLCSVLTNYRNYWTDKVTADDMSEWTYNCMDAVVTHDVAIKIEKELKETDVLDAIK